MIKKPRINTLDVSTKPVSAPERGHKEGIGRKTHLTKRMISMQNEGVNGYVMRPRDSKRKRD